MALKQDLRKIIDYNLRTLREHPLSELSGSLGDLGTLLPLMIAMALQGSIDLPTTLVFSGLTNIFTGLWYGVPLPVQPMKAIAAIAISQGFSKQETAAAGLSMGIAVFVLSASGLLRWLNRVVPVPVVKGIQVAAGLSLVVSAGSSLLLPLGWAHPAYDNRIWAIAAFLLLVIASLFPRLPYALVVFLLGLIMAAVIVPPAESDHQLHAGFWRPTTVVPNGEAWRTGAIDAAIPQLPLTTLNSILAVTSLAATLFPDYPPAPTTSSLGFSIAIANFVGCWFGAMPICHGSGGLAGQYRFGARSGASIVILGLIKFLLGLFVGNGIVPLMQRLPKSLLGIMVLAAGVELAKVGQTVNKGRDLWDQADEDNADGQLSGKRISSAEQENMNRWMVMLITVAGCLAFKNDAVGFIAGLVWHWGLKSPEWYGKLRHGSIRIRQDSRSRESEGLLSLGSAE